MYFMLFEALITNLLYIRISAFEIVLSLSFLQHITLLQFSNNFFGLKYVKLW